jgi:hypothetical protein
MWSGKKVTNELAQIGIDRKTLGAADEKIKRSCGMRGDHNVVIGRVDGDVYDSRTDELLGNVFVEVTRRYRG